MFWPDFLPAPAWISYWMRAALPRRLNLGDAASFGRRAVPGRDLALNIEGNECVDVREVWVARSIHYTDPGNRKDCR